MIESREAIHVCLTKEQYSVYSCLCYFQIFKHPVRASELSAFADIVLSVEEVRIILQELVGQGTLFTSNGFYSLEKDHDWQIKKRLRAEKKFRSKQNTIKKYAHFIARFPFVESVSISGSCSKGLLDDDGDADYFVISSPGRLWLCRTILILFKKIFLFNSKKYFCLNYFIAADALEVPDHNIFVANEIKTLAPASNRQLFEKFLKANKWSEDFLPSKRSYNAYFLSHKPAKKRMIGFFENMLDNKFGDILDNWCHRLTFNTWKKRFSGVERADFELNFRSKSNVSKHHPRGFQKKVLFELHHKLSHVTVT